MSGNRFRNRQIKVWVTEEERAAIVRRMDEAGYKEQSRFMRAMALQGYLINVDLSDFKDYAAQIAKIGNNINQIARKVNMEQEIYSVDMAELQESMRRIEKTVQKCMDVFLGINGEVSEFGNIKDSED